MTISTSVEFADTNVAAYSFDPTAGEKRDVARQLVNRLVEERAGAASIQVLQELYVTLTRKFRPAFASSDARQIVAELAANFRIVEPNSNDVLVAIDNAQRWQVSFWDAMLLTAANKAGASVLWSEDLNDGQRYGGVMARNPFRTSD